MPRLGEAYDEPSPPVNANAPASIIFDSYARAVCLRGAALLDEFHEQETDLMAALADRAEVSRLEVVETGRRRRWTEEKKPRIVARC